MKTTKTTAPVIQGLKAKKDKKFKGSLYDSMGCYSDWICPHCNAHLADTLICLNACHLPQDMQRRFSQLFVKS